MKSFNVTICRLVIKHFYCFFLWDFTKQRFLYYVAYLFNGALFNNALNYVHPALNYNIHRVLKQTKVPRDRQVCQRLLEQRKRKKERERGEAEGEREREREQRKERNEFLEFKEGSLYGFRITSKKNLGKFLNQFGIID